MLSALNCLQQRKKTELRLHGDFRPCPETVTHGFIFLPNQERILILYKKIIVRQLFSFKNLFETLIRNFLPKMFWNNFKKSESVETDKKQILKIILEFRLVIYSLSRFRRVELAMLEKYVCVMWMGFNSCLCFELDSLTKSSDTCTVERSEHETKINPSAVNFHRGYRNWLPNWLLKNKEAL
jgi:hypothetical protein